MGADTVSSVSPLAGPYLAATVVLALAGAVKLADPGGTRVALRTVGLPSSVAVARGLGAVELVLVAGVLAVGGPVPALGVAATYLGFAVVAEVLRRRTDGQADCGCFGAASAPVTRVHVAVDVALAAVALATLADPVPNVVEALGDGEGGGAQLVVLAASVSALVLMALTRERGGRTAAVDAPVAASYDADPVSMRTTGDGHLTGLSPRGGEAVSVPVGGVDHHTLVAFLSSTCVTCQAFWDLFRDPAAAPLPADTSLVLVTKGPEAENARAVSGLAPSTVPAVMSTDAFEQYRVPGAPYFVHVHGPTGRVLAAGTAKDWDGVVALLDRGTSREAHP